MHSSNSRAGLMSGIAMAIYGNTPAEGLEADDAGRHGTRGRALRHARLRAMMEGDAAFVTQRRLANRLSRSGLDD